MSEDNPQISAVQEGDRRIEFVKPDLGLAYANLAPLVTEARMCFKCGRADEGFKALNAARELIETVAKMSATVSMELDEPPTSEDDQ